jgi:hypothetical protein
MSYDPVDPPFSSFAFPSLPFLWQVDSVSGFRGKFFATGSRARPYFVWESGRNYVRVQSMINNLQSKPLISMIHCLLFGCRV